MARRQRSVWPLLKALLLFLTFTVLADTVGLPVVRALASSTPEQAWEAIRYIATGVPFPPDLCPVHSLPDRSERRDGSGCRRCPFCACWQREINQAQQLCPAGS
jgi:hypothetical protein